MNINFQELFKKLNSIDSKMILDALKRVNRRTWFVLAGSSIIVVLFYVFIFSPAWIKRPSLQKKITDIETQTLRLNALLPRKPELEASKSETVNFISELQQKLFKEEEIPFLLGRISKLVKDSNVELLSSRPLELPEAFPEPYSQKYKKFIYLISVEGGYHQIADLVSRLESYEQYFQIQSLAIMPQVNRPGRQIADIKLMAVSYTGGEDAQ